MKVYQLFTAGLHLVILHLFWLRVPILYRSLNILNIIPGGHTDSHPGQMRKFLKNHKECCCPFQTTWYCVSSNFSLRSGKVGITHWIRNTATPPYQSVLQLDPQVFIKYPLPDPVSWDAWEEGYTHTCPAPEAFRIQLTFWDIYLRTHETKPTWTDNKRNPGDIPCFKCNGFGCSDQGKLHRGNCSWVGPWEWEVLFKRLKRRKWALQGIKEEKKPVWAGPQGGKAGDTLTGESEPGLTGTAAEGFSI